jgi:hypothetical protein
MTIEEYFAEQMESHGNASWAAESALGQLARSKGSLAIWTASRGHMAARKAYELISEEELAMEVV